MIVIPKEVGGAKVVLYTPIDERHRHTENCRQIVAGELMGAAAGLAICQYETEDSFYLFGCDEIGKPSQTLAIKHLRTQNSKQSSNTKA